MKRKTMAMWRNLLPARGMDLETADGREVYFHLISVLDDSFDRLTVESEVRFVEEMGRRTRRPARFIWSANTCQWPARA